VRRLTKRDYSAPGSFGRLLEAALAVAEADAEDDAAYHRSCCRLRAAAVDYAAARASAGSSETSATPEVLPAVVG
jgi:hypothetical protein